MELLLRMIIVLFWWSKTVDAYGGQGSLQETLNAKLEYHPFTDDGRSFVDAYALGNPFKPKEFYAGAQYSPREGNWDSRAMYWSNVKDSMYYAFREYSYNAKGKILWIILYHDYFYAKLPWVKFTSGTSADSKDVTMEVQFGDPDVTQYYWRLYDSNRKGNQSHLAINSGNITRPGGGGLKTMGNTAKALITPVEKNKEYIIMYAGLYVIKGANPDRYLIVGMQMIRFTVRDSFLIIPLILLAVPLLIAIPIRIYRAVSGPKDSKRQERMLARKNRAGMVAEEEGAGGTSGGVRKWHQFNDLPSHPVKTGEFKSYVKQVDDKKLKAEFKECCEVGVNSSVSFARKYPKENRYLHLIPYNHSRVPLYPQSAGPMPKDVAPPQYINASYCPGENSIREFIATQGPKKETTLAFWAAITSLYLHL
ncbi:uncharacterized protein LOC142336541 [Convolutriloba macropyga]|uniref:uncharacterized protein LOC142336541 n=1 Tax=Convolutriloba macropyga TaxID=536237 RepID=UPI003F51DE1D